MLHEQSNAAYLSISNGKICRPVQQPTSKSVERVNKNGKLVHEEFYPAISGRITDISVKDHPEFGKFWMVKITDEMDNYVLQFNYSSGYANSFLKALPNVDFSEHVKLSPKLDEKDGKKKTTLFLSQDGHPVKWFYTKDNPNGLPQLRKIKVKGKDTWDDSEIMEFLEQMVNNDIKPQLNQVFPASAMDDENDEAPF